MKTIRKFVILAFAALLTYLADIPPQRSQLPLFGIQLVSDAHAILGRQRRTRRRGLAVGYAAGKSAAQQQQGTTQQQSTTTPQ